jgi:hypothetical protein
MQSRAALRTKRAAVQKRVAPEPRWHAALAIGVALFLYARLPPKIIVGPYWLLPLLIVVILVPLLVISPHRMQEDRLVRIASILNIAVLNVFNVCTIALFFLYELSQQHRRSFNGQELLVVAVQLWLTNVIVYALWFWETDGGGPSARLRYNFEQNPGRADFLFPQMALTPDLQEKLRWRPAFVDYLFLAFTNATAFSPTDTFALSPLAKVLMMAQALTSLITIAIVAGRAINVLSG